MITLITTVLQIIVAATKYIFAKKAEKEQAMKDLVTVYKGLDRGAEKGSKMRDKYQEAKSKMKTKPKGSV